MVEKGQSIRFQVQGNITVSLFGNSTASEVRKAAANELGQYFDVKDLTLTVNGIVDTLVRFEWLTSPYEARLTVATRSAYGTAGDVGSVVAHAFYNATGSLPSVSIVGVDQAQGENVAILPSHLAASAAAGASSLLSQLGTALGAGVDKVNSVVQGNAVILIVGVLVLAYIVAGPGGRNVGAVARAARG